MEIFIYEGNELAIIKKDDDIWFRAKTVANILIPISKLEYNEHFFVSSSPIKLHKNYITFYYYARIVSRKKITTIKKKLKN